MAKKEPDKSKDAASKKKPKGLADDTVEIHVPQALWDQISGLDAKVLKQLIRAVFDHDKLFGVKNVNIVLDKAQTDEERKSRKGFYKICDGP